MSAEFDALKEKVVAQDAKLDTISTNVTGIGADVTALKDKLATLVGGATAAEIAELTTLVDGVGTKIENISTTTADLDAQTDATNV